MGLLGARSNCITRCNLFLYIISIEPYLCMRRWVMVIYCEGLSQHQSSIVRVQPLGERRLCLRVHKHLWLMTDTSAAPITIRKISRKTAYPCSAGFAASLYLFD